MSPSARPISLSPFSAPSCHARPNASGAVQRPVVPLLASYVGVLFGILLLLGGVPTDLRAQSLPSWAEPGKQRTNERPPGNQRSSPENRSMSSPQTCRNGTTSGALSGSSPEGPSRSEGVGIGESGLGTPTAKASVCPEGACGGCPDGQTCISPGKGNASCKCKPNDSGQVQQAVPLDPFGAILLALLGGVYGAIRLRMG